MRKTILVLLLLLVLAGCKACPCHGQEIEKVSGPKGAKAVVMASTAMVVVDATDVLQWKKSIYDGLNRLTGGEPFSIVCDLLLQGAFGFSSIPTGSNTVSVKTTDYDNMMALKRNINVRLGVAIINQATVLEDNREAIDAAIESATETIADEKARKAFIMKAQLLRR